MIPESGRSSGEGNGNPLQSPCLEKLGDRATGQATVHGVSKSQTRLSNEHFDFHFTLCTAAKKKEKDVATNLLSLTTITAFRLSDMCYFKDR